MDLKTFEKFYKSDFNVCYVADYKKKVKDGFYYYKAVEIIEKNKNDILFFSKSRMTWETLCAEFDALFKLNKKYFKNNFLERID
mgnify:FL=1